MSVSEMIAAHTAHNAELNPEPDEVEGKDRTRLLTPSPDNFMPPQLDETIRFITSSPTYDLHDLDFYILTYVYYGSARLGYEGREIPLKAGDAVFCGPHVVHSVQLDADSCVFTNIARPRALRRRMGAFQAELGIFADYYYRCVFGRKPVKDYIYFPRCETVTTQVRQRIESIAENLWENQVPWSLFASAEYLCLMLLLAKGYRETTPYFSEPDSTTHMLTDMIRFIRENYSDASLRMLADQFNYSPTHVSRLLQRHTGLRFAEIVRDLKIHHAMEYLQRSELGLEQISELVGFSSASYLARVFQAQCGMTPGQFRSDSRHFT